MLRNIHPNPMQDKLTINRDDNSSPVEVNITNTKGLLMYEAKSYEDLEIDVSGWSRGMYILTISSASSNYTHLVIKR